MKHLKQIFRLIFSILSVPGRWFRPKYPAPEVRQLDSRYLERNVRIDLYRPPGFAHPASRGVFYPGVLFNDGQDLAAVGLPQTLHRLYARKRIPPLLCVGIYPDTYRMQEYGTADQPDYKKRGARAGAYRNFVLLELLPWLRREYRLRVQADQLAIAGFSLGGLSAFDLVYHHPGHFGITGVFSGALWWRSAPFREKHPDADRIVHDYVAGGDYRPGQRYWFQAGTRDEDNDRNQNGIIDAIDDTLQLMELLRHQDVPEGDLRYREIKGGRHEPKTWAKALPDFLEWGFGAEELSYDVIN